MNESVQKWLDELTAAPSTAIQKLVLGYAGVSAWSRSSLRESFVEIFQTHAEALDAAVAAWLQERLMKLPPEKTPTLVWASHLQDLFSALAGLPLPQVARLLRARLRDLRSWLRPLRTDESLDPEAAYLAALAWADTNQHLEGMWGGLALRRDREPAYYTDIGLLGLRKTRDDRGQLPSKVPFLLLATLIDLADVPGTSQNDWLLTTRALLGGYHYSLETWVREFVPVLEARHEAQNGPKWLKKILSPAHPQDSSNIGSNQVSAHLPSLNECAEMVSQVKRKGPQAVGAALSKHLDSHRAYATATGDAYFLSRTFNRLAEAACRRDPDWAIQRAEEALAWDRSDHRNWKALARCLWARSARAQESGDAAQANADGREAIDILWTARARFPYNDYIRAELARMCRDSGDVAVAETLLREAVVEFPENAVLPVRLADLLIAQNKLREARPLLEAARQLDPDTHLWRNSLANLLSVECIQTRDEAGWEMAVRLFEEARDLGNHDAAKRLKQLGDVRELPPPGSALAFGLLEQDTETVAIFAPALSEMRPAQRLGRALLFQWQAQRAEAAGEREGFFAEAEALLTLPDELTGECRAAFVEARGFLLLARDRATEARSYFEQQLAAFPRPPLGLRLGFAEARARLGETLSDDEEAELASFGPEGSILPLVLKVVRLLESTASDNELRDLLLALYPRVRELAGMPASELGEEDEPAEPTAPARQPETPDTMMAQLLLASVFRPAAINTPADLQGADFIPRIRTSFKARRDDIFAVTEKLALDLAA